MHSFEHVAIDKRVIACDIAHVPLEDESLDLATFCLSLKGANFTDNFRLRLDGTNISAKRRAASRTRRHSARPGRLSFEVTSPNTEGAFVRIYAIRKPDANLVLPFRGAVTVS